MLQCPLQKSSLLTRLTAYKEYFFLVLGKTSSVDSEDILLLVLQENQSSFPAKSRNSEQIQMTKNK